MNGKRSTQRREVLLLLLLLLLLLVLVLVLVLGAVEMVMKMAIAAAHGPAIGWWWVVCVVRHVGRVHHRKGSW